MKVLSKEEMKKLMGGMAQVVCNVAVNQSNPCSGKTSWSCGSDLDTCQDQADGICDEQGGAYYDCCDDVTCKYA